MATRIGLVVHCRHPKGMLRFLCGARTFSSANTGNTYRDTNCEECILLAFSYGFDHTKRISNSDFFDDE